MLGACGLFLFLHLSWTFVGRFGGQGPAFNSSTGGGGLSAHLGSAPEGAE